MPSFSTDQLAFHLPFSEPTGVHVHDDSPAGRNLTIVGPDLSRYTGPFLYTGLPGYTGPYPFTGPNQCTGLSIGGQGLTGASFIQGDTGTYGDVFTGDFSLACWIRPRWGAHGAVLNNYNICSKYPEVYYYPYFEIGLEDDHWYCMVDFRTGNQSDFLVAQGTHNLTEDSWAHIAITVKRLAEGISAKFYINGVLHNGDVGMGPNAPYNTKSLSNDGRFKIFKVEESHIAEYGHHILTDLWFFHNHLLTDSEVVGLFRVLG